MKFQLSSHPNTVPTGKILRVYLTERLSLSETARQLGIKRHVVEREIKQAGHKLRPVGEAVRLAKIGRPRLTLSLRAGAKQSVDKWKIVELKAAGQSTPEIARQLGRSWPSIYLALRKLGFPDGKHVSPFYSFGEEFDQSSLRRLHDVSGLNVIALAQQLNLSYATLWPQIRAKKRQLKFTTARKASEWWSGLYRHLMSGATPHPGGQSGKYSQSRVIVTFFPNLRERYSLLLEVFPRVAEKLRDNPEWSRDELQQYLCQQAMLEKAAANSGDLFVRFLPWAPELIPFLASKLHVLRGIRHQRLAWEIIACSLGTTAPIISSILNPTQARKIRPIPPEQMRWLILNWNRGNATAAPLLVQQGQHKPPAPTGRKRKDEVARRVTRMKTKFSWAQLTIEMNKEARRSGLKEGTKESYRSLYRTRKKKLATTG